MMYWLVGIIGFVVGELTGIALESAYRCPHVTTYKIQSNK